MLKVALPRPSSDAVTRGEGRTPPRPWFEDDEDPAPRPLTRDEAEALRQREPVLSPWRVVLAQLVLGAIGAALIGLASDSILAAQSALYGAAVIALPGALMARGATSRISALSPLISTVSMMAWEFAKMAMTIVMLVLAPRLVPGLIWPAMLVTLVVCLQTYWLALLWRGRAK